MFLYIEEWSAVWTMLVHCCEPPTWTAAPLMVFGSFVLHKQDVGFCVCWPYFVFMVVRVWLKRLKKVVGDRGLAGGVKESCGW